MNYDVIIVGSGIVGATAALALAKQTQLTIAVVDAQTIFPAWNKACYEARVSAISLASQRIFQSLGVWEKIIAKRVSPYSKMHVWEAQGEIHFDCKEVRESVLGHIIEDQVIRESLHDTFSAYPAIHFLHPVQLSSIEKKSEKIYLHTQNAQTLSAKLIIAADGAHSWIREQMHIPLKEYDYGHTAIVTTVKTELPHAATARQRFLSTGPLAFLPMDDPHYCSIVWSTQPEMAQQLMASDEATFCQSISEAFEYKLGEVIHCDKRHVFPLRMRHAKNYVQENLALIGDAAHTIHPLAGQGVNLGLLDAASLAQVIVEAIKKERECASLPTLRRYERWRKSDNAVMLSGVAMLKQLFASEQQIVKTLRTRGLNLIDRLAIIKNLFAHHALGNRFDLPKAAQKTIR